MPKQYVVIILGLGEATSLYRWYVKNWEKDYGIIPVIHVVGWRDSQQSFDSKQAALIKRIETIASSKASVSLIGVSAGASAALNAYLALQKRGVTVQSYVSVCGRFNFAAHRWYPLSYGVKRIPLFQESVRRALEAQPLRTKDYARITCFFSSFDEVTPRSASTLPATSLHNIPFLFHTPSIHFLFLFPRPLLACITSAKR